MGKMVLVQDVFFLYKNSRGWYILKRTVDWEYTYGGLSYLNENRCRESVDGHVREVMWG